MPSVCSNLTCISVKNWKQNDDGAYRVKCHIKQQNMCRELESKYWFLIRSNMLAHTRQGGGEKRDSLLIPTHKLQSVILYIERGSRKEFREEFT